MSHRPAWSALLALALLLAPVLRAQPLDPHDPALAAQGEAAWVDWAGLGLLQDLNFTAAQVDTLIGLTADYQSLTLRARQAADTLAAAAWNDIAAAARALGAGRAAPDTPALWRWEQATEQAERARTDALAYLRMQAHSQLTPGQRAVLARADAQVIAGGVLPPAPTRALVRAQRTAWREQVRPYLVTFLRQALAEPNDQRYQWAADGYARSTAQAVTGGYAASSLVWQLAPLYRQTMDRARRLSASEVERGVARLANGLLAATMDIAAAQPAVTGSGLPNLPAATATTAEFEAFLAEPRTPELLRAWRRGLD